MTTAKKTTGRTTPKGTQPRKGAPSGPTSAAAWKSKSAEGTLLTVPSGNTCLVKPIGLAAFMKKGVIPNGLIPLIQDSIKKGGVPEDVNIESILEDEGKLQQILELADSICVDAVLDPKVAPAPAEGEDRDPNVLYVDEVDFNDKMFIFNFVVGGTADLEQFR